jgi:hypothetical protein
MKRINISKPNQYYSQINNTHYPHSACNVTSLTESLDITDQLFDYPKDIQPEDFLMNYLRSDESYKLMDEKFPWARKNGYEPNEVHGMLQWAVNKLVGKDVDEFSTEWTLKRLLFEVLNFNPVSVSGWFTDYGHIVVLVGFETEQQNIFEIKYEEELDINKVKKIIIDDPYGDYFTEYESIHGNDIKFEKENFIKLVERKSGIWGHLITIK